MITEVLTQALSSALADYGVKKAVVSLEHPVEEQFGDWSSNAALQYIKQVTQFAQPK